MPKARNPVRTIEVKMKPRGFMSWAIEHVRPSVSILPSLDGNDDVHIGNISEAWEFVKDRVEFKIGLTFKF